MRGPQWAWLPWMRRRAARAAILEAAERNQRDEYEAAVRRLRATASWNARTEQYDRPLMTLGQLHRSRPNQRP